MTENEMDRALEAALGEDEPRAIERTIVDHHVEHINRLLVDLHVRESKQAEHIRQKMEELRSTQRAIVAYELTLRRLT